jgi:hypothetical protein
LVARAYYLAGGILAGVPGRHDHVGHRRKDAEPITAGDDAPRSPFEVLRK